MPVFRDRYSFPRPAADKRGMWCRACQQDVPGIAAGVVPRPRCARCGNDLLLAEGGTPLPLSAPPNMLQCGIDLTKPPPHRASESLSRCVDWEIGDRLKQIERVLAAPDPPSPNCQRRLNGSGRGPLRARELGGSLMDTGTWAAPVQSDPEHRETSDGPTPRFFWTTLGLMVAFLAAAGAFWLENLTIPGGAAAWSVALAVGGGAAVLSAAAYGVAAVASRIWRNPPRTARDVNEGFAATRLTPYSPAPGPFAGQSWQSPRTRAPAPERFAGSSARPTRTAYSQWT